MHPRRFLLSFLAFCLTLGVAFGAIDDSIDVLTKAYGKAEPDTYRPDLHPTSYRFKPRGMEITVTPIGARAKKIDVFFAGMPVQTVETLLQRYSGRRGWKPVPTTDPAFAKHFPGFDAEEKKNTFYASDGVVALVQRDTGFGKLVLWIQTTDYPDLLAEYRKAKKSP